MLSMCGRKLVNGSQLVFAKNHDGEGEASGHSASELGAQDAGMLCHWLANERAAVEGVLGRRLRLKSLLSSPAASKCQRMSV